MDATPDNELLSQLGLNKNEVIVYRGLLQLGPQKASDLSTRTGLTRTNTYNVLNSLELRNLIRRDGGGRKTVFFPLHPQRLEQLVDAQEQEVRARRQQLKESMQHLVVDFSLAEGKPGVFRFEGKAGMIRVYEELIRDKVTVNSLVNRELLRAAISEYNPEYIRKRLRNKIASRVLTPASGTIISDDSRERREVRYLDPQRFPFEMDLKITSKKVVMTTLRDEQIGGIIIVDSEVIRNYTILFEFLWTMGITAEELKGKPFTG